MKKIAILGLHRFHRNPDIWKWSERITAILEVTCLWRLAAMLSFWRNRSGSFHPKIAAVWNEEKAKELKDRVQRSGYPCRRAAWMDFIEVGNGAGVRRLW